MSRIFFSCIIACIVYACKPNTSDVTQFRTGTYKTYLDKRDVESTAIRNDSIQIEYHEKGIDTFAIIWKSNFEYELLKLNPKKGLDSVPFYVKITGVKNNTYTFKAYYKDSNFKQQGKAVKQLD